MRIPFEIKYRPQIESGEYRVETKAGCPVRIVCWDMACELPILGLVLLNDEKAEEMAVGFTNEGTNLLGEPLYDKLFIVTPGPEPGPELSEFEERIFKLLRQYKECDIPLTPENIKAEASMLWSDFEKYFFYLYGKEGEGDSALRSFYYRGLAEGKAEALKDRALELTKQLNESGLDENSIEYNLIEFMCNLMDCPNWNEIVETAGLYAGRIKAEALKDLPRWYESRGVYSDGWINDGFLYYKNHSIQLSSLEKLTGFKES